MTVVRTLAGAVLLFFSSALAAQSLGTVIAADVKKLQANEASQKRIDNIVSDTDKLQDDYRQITKETDGLKVYIELLQSQVNNQEREIENLQGGVERVTVIERQIIPQMKKMIDALEDFIALDMPFLLEERTERIARLNRLLGQADISVAEKFRAVVEAYNIESGFGRSIESYKGTVQDGGQELEVDFLRIGRIGLYWQNPDATLTKAWDRDAKQWVALGNEYRSAVRTGLQIADEQKAPELLLVPVPAPEAS
jgi:archaellum component FlaC